MHMKTSIVAVLAGLLLAACGPASLADQEHSVEEYYANDQLTADTLEACRARNDAELRAMASKPACVNARAAQERHEGEAAKEHADKWQEWRQEREEARKKDGEE